MPAEARITPTWSKQKLFVSLFLFAIGAYFFWDGLVGYPHANTRYAAWKQHSDEGRLNDWPAFAQSKGWKADEWRKWLDDPHQHGQVPAERWSRGKILEQLIWGGFVVGLGAIAFAYWSSQKKRIVRTDEEAVYAPSGARIPFSAITGLGKKKWDDKGLATVRYEIDGRKGKFILDDYKYDRDPTHQILAEIEAALVARSAEPAQGS
jgi:hypothetical protein